MVRVMRNTNNNMIENIDAENLETAMRLLAARLDLAQTEPIGVVVCGGSALIAQGLIQRATKDVDVVALMDSERRLVSPAPLPGSLLKAAKEVARDMGLPDNWLNNGPSRDEGGLFQLGLPEGMADRLNERVYGPRLTVFFVGRFDQIHFKLYAAADRRDGTHLDDLLLLKPTAAELETAARWAMTHDVSPGFRTILKDMLRQVGHESVADRI
ncbi:MAG: hypothetical protein ABSH28_01370 [Acidobacteriota bacterium]|jgi:hypothetical protein